jgi:type VI protein secretion system component Hcp
MPIYMQYEGVSGEVTAKGHEGWVELQSVQPIKPGSNLNISGITITKFINSISIQLRKFAHSNKPKDIIIDLVYTSGATYLRLTLTDAVISSYNSSSSDGATGQALESLSLNCKNIRFERYIPKGDNPEDEIGPGWGGFF